MKNTVTKIITLLFSFSALFSKDWVNTGEINPSEPAWTIHDNSEDFIELSFKLNGYFIEKDYDGNSQISFP
ncbi:MAG: hypothetical protein CMF94_04690, partial [Candidatus Marinimicrobia bacterium]|nr:hypothetical protein [Candidatus Neomarinimicrobiota bacterium]